jgi:hypothetical protein
MRKWLLTTAIIATASAASAQTAPAPAPAQRSLSVTVYNSDLALVEDVRTINIASGRQRLEFKDVSPRIRSETVTLSAPGVGIVEQNFDYDLLSPETLMEKAVGQTVKIVRTNPGNGQQVTETATVLAVNDGVVLQIGDRIEVLRDDGIPTRVIFDRVPPNLRARPTLSVTVDSAKAGVRDARLSYLTNGLSWKADYVALFDEKAGKLDLQGWVTLTNTSGATFDDAELQLVAGNINLVRSQQEYWQREQYARQTRGRTVQPGMEAGEGGGARSAADYYLYPMPEKTTIAQNQTKQIGFLDSKGVAAKKAYQYRAWGFQSEADPTSADVVLKFANSTTGGLGAQLPSGILRVYMRDAAGEPKFIGESSIPHTPRGSDLAVKTGEAFDVTVQPTLMKSEKVTTWRTRYTMKYVVRNARSESVTVEVVQPGLWRDGKVLDESQTSRRVNASTLAWDVVVPAAGETVLTFTVETGW